MLRGTIIALLALGALPALQAQGTGEISGVVRDSSQAPLANVRVTISNQATRSEVISYSDDHGFYRAVNLAPGQYTVEAARPGFQAAIRRDLNVRQDEAFRLDLELATAAGGWSWPAPGTLILIAITAFLTLLISELGRKLLRTLWKPVTWVKDKAYSFLAPRFPDWIGVPGYHKRIERSALSRIEIPIGPRTIVDPRDPKKEVDLVVTLEQAYAPLMLVTGDRQERVDLLQFAAAHPRLIVLGGPGTGKTTLMKSLVLSILQGRCPKELNPLLPIFVVLREMAKAGHTVQEAIMAALGSFGFKKAERFVESALESGRMLIVLDGLDEVGTNREAVADKIRAFCRLEDQRNHKNHLIVTCREHSYNKKPDLAEAIPLVARVEPFAPQHMRAFLQGWPSHKGRAPLRLYQELREDPQVFDICRNPLMLTILTGLYLERDRFDLPSSRESFYATALEELLVARPARRSIQQKFGDDYKRQVLQRVALDRLETVRGDEDPELLGRDRLRYYSNEVRGGDLKEADFRELLDELVHINGVLKPAAEDAFVLGHRTFQEYLAAREANRTRRVAEVLDRFSARSELSEVLCFYCGLVRNIPQLNSVLQALLERGEALLAARCLLNVTEIPDHALIEAAASALLEPIRSRGSGGPELELLSSLAQRRSREFDPARRCSSEAIDVLLVGARDAGAAGLVSALSATPDIAMELIPGLLNHPSPQRRIAAVQLLHDLGTEDALDRLVQLLQALGESERVWAAALLAGLIRGRHAELKQRALLLPERVDRRIWPFEGYFPGRLAIPIIESLAAGDPETSPPYSQSLN